MFADAHSTTVLKDQLRLHYVRKGTGPSVLLLHGWPCLWYDWRHLIHSLTEFSDVIAPDFKRIGLLNPVSRSANGYRQFSSKDIAWLEFLNRLRATGMSISQMQQFAFLRR